MIVLGTRQCCSLFLFFFFNDTATTEIYTLSLHDALPICSRCPRTWWRSWRWGWRPRLCRSEEHTSELQSRFDLVCRLLLEKKKNTASIQSPVSLVAQLPVRSSQLALR